MKKIDILIRPMKWFIDFDNLFLFEIETEKVSSFLPSCVQVSEIRPGICLMGIGVQIFKPGNQDLPSFKEVYWFIMVASELRYKMPIPNFSSYVGNVTSDCFEFLCKAKDLDKMPIFSSESININIDPLNYKFFVEDKDGPILELKVSEEARKKSPYPKKIWGQQTCKSDNCLYIGASSWEGEMYEYQKSSCVGRVYSHPFFRGIEVGELGHNCHTQMIASPSSESMLTFYEPLLR